jgi:hypothetical protein
MLHLPTFLPSIVETASVVSAIRSLLCVGETLCDSFLDGRPYVTSLCWNTIRYPADLRSVRKF